MGTSVSPWWWALVVKDATHRTAEGMCVSKLEYFRVIFLVCKAVAPGADVDEGQLTRDYERDCGYGTIVSRKGFQESIFEVADVAGLSKCNANIDVTCLRRPVTCYHPCHMSEMPFL